MNHTVILACSSFRDYLAAAQEKMGTDLPVIWLDERLHRDPKLMRQAIVRALEGLPPEVDTVLVSMGFCGGSWADITARVRLVLPRADDCVSILLHRQDRHGFDLKERDHLYVKCADPSASSFEGIFRRMTEGVDEGQTAVYLQRWRDSYAGIDVIDTGVYDCSSDSYLAPVRSDARFLQAEVHTVPGSNLLLEKLVSGRWDEDFCIVPPGETVTKSRVEGEE